MYEFRDGWTCFSGSHSIPINLSPPLSLLYTINANALCHTHFVLTSIKTIDNLTRLFITAHEFIPLQWVLHAFDAFEWLLFVFKTIQVPKFSSNLEETIIKRTNSPRAGRRKPETLLTTIPRWSEDFCFHCAKYKLKQKTKKTKAWLSNLVWCYLSESVHSGFGD